MMTGVIIGLIVLATLVVFVRQWDEDTKDQSDDDLRWSAR